MYSVTKSMIACVLAACFVPACFQPDGPSGADTGTPAAEKSPLQAPAEDRREEPPSGPG